MRVGALVLVAFAGCAGSPPAGGDDLSAALACPADAAAPAAADSGAAADLATLPPDLAVCWSMACPRLATCADYTNAGPVVEYLTCCHGAAGTHCHDALGLGEACASSSCAPGEMCANGFPNGGTTILILICCGSAASAPTVSCTAGN